jgi:hypothetical protein
VVKESLGAGREPAAAAPRYGDPGSAPLAQPQHVGDHLGHGLVVRRRDDLADLAGGMERPCQGRILDDRDPGGGGHTPDPQGHGVDALGSTSGAAVSPLTYRRATATWVGLVITTVARGTSAIIRRRARSSRSARNRCRMCGSPSLCFSSSRSS